MLSRDIRWELHVGTPVACLRKEYMEDNETKNLRKTNDELLLALQQANTRAEELERRYCAEVEQVEALTESLATVEVHGPKTSMTDTKAFEWAWAELKKQLGAERWKVGEEAQSWAFFKYGWDNRNQLELQRYKPPVTDLAPLCTLKALQAAVAALYFDDSSDYQSALWSVAQNLDPVLAGVLLDNPKSAYDQACARLAGVEKD